MGLTGAIVLPKPLRVITAYRTTNGIDVPLRIITRNEYINLGNKTTPGYPNSVYYDPQRETGTLYLYPVPDATVVANTTIVIYYQRPFDDFDNAADEPDFPQEWFDALKYGLATRLAPEYGVPISERQLLMAEMTRIKQEALSMGTEEGSLYFAPDIRSY
jgi:hypothetical protein